MRPKIRVLIVDDHAVVRKGLILVLKRESDIEVVGEADNGKSGIELVKSLQPDVVVADLIMPLMDGHEMAIKLRKTFPNTKIIMLTGTEVDDRVNELISLGIEGYALKNIDPPELIQGIRTIFRGETFLQPEVMKRVIETIRPSRNLNLHLTSRELEILNWMATANTYKQIANELNISEETVRSHAKNILEKMKQPNRAQAVLEAVRSGLITLS